MSIIGNVIDISGAAGGSLAVHLRSATDLTALTMYGTKGAAAEDAVQTRVKAGVPSDADFSKHSTGCLVLDSTDGRLYFRYGGAWHYVTQTA